jgi:hypothetical protein
MAQERQIVGRERIARGLDAGEVHSFPVHGGRSRPPLQEDVDFCALGLRQSETPPNVVGLERLWGQPSGREDAGV